jgi:ferric-dicitrate binding protein FerR (iron transport regulator)
MSRRRAERVLNELTRELRSSPSPELDWAAIESRLPRSPAPDHKPHFPTTRLLLTAAAFAVVAAALSFRFARVEPPAPVVSQMPAPVAVGPLNGDAMLLGAQVRATSEPKHVEHIARATWTLAPGSRASIVERGERLVVRLEQGSLRVHVVPSTAPETFAVEAADVRVAAHGTVFEVSLGAEGVAVDVSEGRVLVGPRVTPGSGKLLQAPSIQRFSLVGEPLQKPAPKARDHATKQLLGPEPAASTPREPEQPSAEQAERILNDVIALTSSCFRQRTTANDGVKVTAHTALTLSTTREGSIKSVSFEPPLAPSVQACVSAGAPALRAAPTRAGFSATRSIDVER